MDQEAKDFRKYKMKHQEGKEENKVRKKQKYKREDKGR